MFEILEHIFDHALVEGAKVSRTESKWIFADKVDEVPIDKLPIKSIIVAKE